MFGFCSKNLRKHFEVVDYCLIVLFLPFDDNCPCTVSLNKCVYYFEQRLNVISQVSKSAPNFLLNALGFQQVGAKIATPKICKCPALVVGWGLWDVEGVLIAVLKELFCLYLPCLYSDHMPFALSVTM